MILIAALMANQNPIFKNHMLMLLPRANTQCGKYIMGPAGKISSFDTHQGGHCNSGTIEQLKLAWTILILHLYSAAIYHHYSVVQV